MTLKELRKTYSVPFAKRGYKVKIGIIPGTILGAKDVYLKIRRDDIGKTAFWHPWSKMIEYLGKPGALTYPRIEVLWGKKDVHYHCLENDPGLLSIRRLIKEQQEQHGNALYHIREAKV